MSVPVLEVEDIRLRIGGVVPVDGVTFDVRQGEILAVIGPNGAGKTSLFNCVNGVYVPQEGSIRFLGEDIRGRRPARIARMGLSRTFQNLGLFDRLDVVDNLMLGRHNLMTTGFLTAALRVGPAARQERRHREAVADIANLLDLGQYVDRPVGALPYGVRKRVELGRALAAEPKLLLLDEPAAGMNRHETDQLTHTLAEVNRELGLTTVLIEHDMTMVMALAERVMALEFGRHIVTDVPAVVQRHPEVVRSYLGAPSTDLEGAAPS